MKKCYLLAAVAVTLWGGLDAGAQDLSHPWTLSECIDWALEHNIDLLSQQNSIDRDSIELSTTKLDRLPSLSASASENLSFGRGLTADNTYANTNTTSTSFTIGSGVNIFNGFRAKNNIKIGSLNLEASVQDLEKARDDIRVAVARAFFQILYNQEILGVAERQIEIDSAQVVRLGEMLLAGKATQAEVAQQKASLAQSRVTLVQAGNELQLSLLELAQLLELPSPEGFRVSSPDAGAGVEERLLPSPESIYASAVENKPSVKAEQLRLQSSDASIALAKSGLYPSLSLSGGLGSNYYTTSQNLPQSGFWDQLSNNFSQYVGVSLNIPIFNKLATRNGIRSAKLGRESQALRLENVKKSLYKEIQQAYYNALAAKEKYTSSLTASASYEEAFNLVTARYENGKATITEFNESKNQYLKAASDLVQASYEYLFQTRLLDFYRGGTL